MSVAHSLLSFPSMLRISRPSLALVSQGRHVALLVPLDSRAEPRSPRRYTCGQCHDPSVPHLVPVLYTLVGLVVPPLTGYVWSSPPWYPVPPEEQHDVSARSLAPAPR